MGRALVNDQCCYDIRLLKQMSNHRKRSRKGSKIIPGSNLNAYNNAGSFCEIEKHHACKQHCHNCAAKSGVKPSA